MLKAFIFPEVNYQLNSALTQLNSHQTLHTLVKANMYEFIASNHLDFKNMTALAREIPAYRLSIGNDIWKATALLQNLLN